MSAPNQLQCPRCGQSIAIDPIQRAQMAGHSVACNACGQAFVVPPVGAVAPLPGSREFSQYPTVRGSNGMATAALVCGLVFFVPVCWLLAIIFGIIGLVRAKDPSLNGAGRGRAIAGIVLGAAWLPMIALMVSILLPNLNMARERANRVACASNLRTIGQSLEFYTISNKDMWPDHLEDLFTSQGLQVHLLVCPSTTDTPAPGNSQAAAQAAALQGGHHDSYIYLGKGHNKASEPPNFVIVCEPLSNHHQGINVLFADGHIQFIPLPAAATAISELQAGQNPPRSLRGY